MNNKITIISRPGCFYCAHALKILEVSTSVDWGELIIDKDISRDTVITEYPHNQKLPIVLLNDELLGEGTYADLLDFIYPPLERKG